MITAFRKHIQQLVSDNRGVAALEFALATPFLIALFVASTDLMRLMLVHQKTERIAYSVADLVAQTETLTPADIQQIFLAPAEIMEPTIFGARGRVIVTSVHKADDNAQTLVRWQCAGGGTMAAVSAIGTVGNTATLPEGMTINGRENVIVAEVFYDFDPWFPAEIAPFMAVPIIYKTAVFKPRFGSLLTSPC